MTDKSEESVELHIRFRIPQKMPSVVATEMIVQPNADGVLLSFFEIIPPLVSSDVTKEQMESIRQSGVPAECVSRVFVPKSKFKSFVDAMASVIEPPKKEAKPSKRK